MHAVRDACTPHTRMHACPHAYMISHKHIHTHAHVHAQVVDSCRAMALPAILATHSTALYYHAEAGTWIETFGALLPAATSPAATSPAATSPAATSPSGGLPHDELRDQGHGNGNGHGNGHGHGHGHGHGYGYGHGHAYGDRPPKTARLFTELFTELLTELRVPAEDVTSRATIHTLARLFTELRLADDVAVHRCGSSIRVAAMCTCACVRTCTRA